MTTTQGNQDPSSMYYIHPSDASSTQLVSIKFNGTGFHNWKRSMMLTLSAKNKLGFVDGTISIPETTSADYKYWSRCNDLIISWLIFNLDDTIAKSVLFLPTAREIWSDLEDRFGYASMTQVYSLEQQLSDLTQGNQSVSEFFTSIKTIWDGLADTHPLPSCTCNKCTCNLLQRIVQRQQEEKLLQFMMKLNENYAAVRGNILMMHPLPNVSQAYRLFAQEERHKELSQGMTSESLAFLVDKRRFPNSDDTRRGFHGKTNFTSSNFKQQVSGAGNKRFTRKPGSHYYCTHCKIPGHIIDRCFKVHGFPPNFKGNKDRVAAFVHTDETLDVTDQQSKSQDNSSLSIEQYNQMLDFFNKQQLSNVASTSETENTDHAALLAGPFTERSSSSSW